MIILQLVDGILLLATEIPALMARAKLLKGEMQVFADENRSPTDAEWATLNVKTNDMLGWMQTRADQAQAFLDSQGGDST